MKRVLIFLAVAAGLAAVTVGGVMFHRLGNVLTVEIVRPVRGDITTYVEESGRLRLDRWQVVSTPLGGMLGPVLVDSGDPVKKGQVIARLDDTSLREGIRQARASLLEIEARIEGLKVQLPRPAEIRQAALGTERATRALEVERRNAGTLRTRLTQVERDLKRLQNLARGGVSATADVEQLSTEKKILCDTLANQTDLIRVAELNIELARQVERLLTERQDDTAYLKDVFASNIEQVRSRIAVIENDRKRTEIHAPFDGVVLRRLTRGSTFCPPGTPLVRIGDLSTLEVEVDLLSDDVPLIDLLRKAQISGRSLGDRTFTGAVHRIYPSAFTKISSLGIEQQRVRVILVLDEHPKGLRPGIAVDVKIVARQTTDVLLVPESSIFTRLGKSCVFVLRQGHLALAVVEEGVGNDEFVEILSGLSPSDEVVTRPDNDMEEGRPARVASDVASGVASGVAK